MRVVATAGHVDHGKSTLVRALTGTDPDRFEEERRRGLTIDLGFAHFQTPAGHDVAFVDVPGHVRFVKNMLAGVGAVDACLFVVDATEGWKPQSEEHLRIVDLLAIAHGVVALTKAAPAGPDLVELVGADVAEHLAGSSLAGSEIVAVDSVTGAGLPELVAALDRLVATAPAPEDHDRPRLWIDRSFAMPGAGTVVTGTLSGGRLAVGETVAVVTARGEVTSRIRGLQSFGRTHDALEPGSRAAVNLGDVHHDAIGRGDALVRPGQWHVTAVLDASLSVLGATAHELRREGPVVCHVGSAELQARARVIGPDPLGPGSEGLVRLRLERAVPLLPGDRFVLRDAGRSETIGGGVVLDVDPTLPAARARPDRSATRVVAERGWVTPDELERLTGERHHATVGRWIVDPGIERAARAAAHARVAAAGAVGLDAASLDERERALLEACDDVVVTSGRAALRQHVGADPYAGHPFVAALEARPFDPPSPAEAGVSAADLAELVRRGHVLSYDGCWFAPAALETAARVAATLLAARPEGVTVAELRDAWGTTRKWALPLVGLLDHGGYTRRRGDLRIAGPALARLGSDYSST